MADHHTLNLEINKENNIKYNKHKTNYVCDRCGTIFHDKSIYKTHLIRKRPCGQFDNNYLVIEQQNNITCLLQKYTSTTKTNENKKILSSYINQMERSMKIIIALNKVSIPEQKEYFEEIQMLRDEINNIA